MMVHPVKRPFTTSAYLASTTRRTMAADWIMRGVPRWVTLVDELLFVVSSLIFVRGSADFFPGTPLAQYIEGCELFIIGSVLNVGLSIFAVFEIFSDARLCGKAPNVADLAEQALYVIGSLLFLAGTVLFTPPLPAADAVDAVVGASVSGALELPWFGQTIVVQSGVLPPPPTDAIELGDAYFIIGSILYSVAAFVSSLRAAGEGSGDPAEVLRRRTAVATGTLYQLGGVAFVVGTLGFIPGSALGISACPDGPRTMETAGAALFVGGSGCYLLGSLLTLGVVGYLTYSIFEVPVRAADASDSSLRFGPPLGVEGGVVDSVEQERRSKRAAGSPTYDEYVRGSATTGAVETDVTSESS